MTQFGLFDSPDSGADIAERFAKAGDTIKLDGGAEVSRIAQDVDLRAYNGVRTDIHRPSVIDPGDYVFVAFECVKVFPGDFGACQFQQSERERIRKHMLDTGGNYSGHAHGGNCMVCGNANAIYTILFYHAKSNTYVRMGEDCARKCEMGADFLGMSRFRSNVDDWRQAQTGKNKARLLLGDRELGRGWDLYTAAWCEAFQSEEITIRDIVGKLVKYGSISDKQYNLIALLLRRIDSRADRQAAKLAEQAAAADCPNDGKRAWFEGKVLTVRVDDTPYGSVTRMLVQHATGFKIWGTRPAGLNCDRGDTVGFSTVIVRSDKDPKFGFYSRPTKPVLIDQSAAARAV